MSNGFRADLGVAYALLRITMGVNLFLHGATRLPHVTAFVDGTARAFALTPLPHVAVVAFAYEIPPIEVILGLAIGLGFGLRVALPLASIYMIALTAGTLFRADYAAVAQQLLYSLVFAIAIALRSSDRFSIDRARVAGRPTGD